ARTVTSTCVRARQALSSRHRGMFESQADLRAVFNEALDRTSPAEQAVYLDEACRDNPKLRARVEALLRAHAAAGKFLGEPAGAANLGVDEPSDLKGRRGGGRLEQSRSADADRPTQLGRERLVNLSKAELRSLLQRRLVIVAVMMVVGGCILHGN